MLSIFNAKCTTAAVHGNLDSFPNYEGEVLEYIFPLNTAWHPDYQFISHNIKDLNFLKTHFRELDDYPEA